MQELRASVPKHSDSAAPLTLSQPSRCSQQPLLLRLSLRRKQSTQFVTCKQRGDLADGWRVTVIVAGQVPSAPAPMSDTVLAVVTWAENPVETEEQQNQQDARRQAKSCNPG